MEKVVSFHGGLFYLEEKLPDERRFHIGFEGQRLVYNDQEVDLRYKGSVTVTREKGMSKEIQIPLVPNTLVWISFDCEVTIFVKSSQTFQLSVDGNDMVTIRLPIQALEFDEETIPLEIGQTFHYRRTSGESTNHLRVIHNGTVLGVPFVKTLTMAYIPCVEDSDLPWDSMKLPTLTTDNHIRAWKYQQVGYDNVLRPDGSVWEPVELTDVELEAISNNRKRKRQKEFEEKCGCV